MTQAEPAKLAAAHEVAARYESVPDLNAIYLAGSLTAGLGTTRSDVDLYVVCDTQPSAGVVQHYVADERIDVDIRTTAWLRSLGTEFDTYEFTKKTFTDAMDVPWISAATSAIRAQLSVPIRRSAEYDRAIERIAANRPNLRRFLITRYTGAYLNQFEDCIGAHESADVGGSLITSHALLLSAADAFLAGADDLYVGAKWIAAKLARSAPRWATEVVSLLWPTDGEAGPGADAGDVVVRRVRMAQVLAAAAQALGWDEPVAPDFPLPVPGGGGPRRALLAQTCRASDGAILGGLGLPQLHISPQGVLLWGLCDGRPRHEVVAAMLSRTDGVTPEEIDRYLDALIARGFVTA